MEYFITESQYHLLSTRRRSDAIERVVDNVMESMYTCDYKNSNHFIKGVSDELYFYYQDVDDLKDLPYPEISEFLFNGLFHHITGYWEERCGGQKISETIVTSNTYKKNLTNDFKIFAKVLNTTNSPGMMNKLGLIKNIDGLLVYYTSDGLMCLQIDKSLLNELKH